ncbi:lysosomal-associated transmembrane protein 5 isoform X2 [Protopterus annectens]|uniref:lysosomal-associated transmembrane protein 5 isoform X2 n=1 Tax=Protopterus annectens TaxID=7888 RepID=UPI001CF9C19C|nr:lysosomal-associated transmembrane protein 5 isoform X2 [Protopterus annectens]
MTFSAPLQDFKNMYRCCCCHVRTATIVLAIYWMVLCASALIFEIVVITNGSGFSDLPISLLVAFTMFLIGVCLLYGALKHREVFLIPFLVMQILDICLAVWAVFCSYVDIPAQLNYKYSMIYMISADGAALGLSTKKVIILTVVEVLLLIFKVYLIDCVWTCYKYIKARNQADVRMYPVFEMSDKVMLPTYDEAIKLPTKQAPPPAYTEA